MASASEAKSSAEVIFAQKLASNKRKIRNKAIKRLEKYLSLKSSQISGLSDDDLLKIWKGLHYCMWMQDKSLVQEELSTRITGLVNVFPNAKYSLRFIDSFFATIAREWIGIDNLRLDKYLMFVRDMLNSTFKLLASFSWSHDNCHSFANTIESKVMSPEESHLPDGLRIHLSDIFIEELNKVNTKKLKVDILLVLVIPFIKFVVLSSKAIIVKRLLTGVISDLFEFVKTKNKTDNIVEKGEEVPVDKKGKGKTDSKEVLSSDDESITIILNHMLQLCNKPGVKSENRTAVYNLVKQYPNVLAKLEFETIKSENVSLHGALDKNSIGGLKAESIKMKQNNRKRKKSEDCHEVSIEVDHLTSPTSNKSPASKKCKISSDDNDINHNVKKSMNLCIYEEENKDNIESEDKTYVPSCSSSKIPKEQKIAKNENIQRLADSFLNESNNVTDSVNTKIIQADKPILQISQSINKLIDNPKHTLQPIIQQDFSNSQKDPLSSNSESLSKASLGISLPAIQSSSPFVSQLISPLSTSSSATNTSFQTPNSKKKVVIDLKKNVANKFSDYIKSLKTPLTPETLTPTKSPAKSILKIRPASEKIDAFSSFSPKKKGNAKKPKKALKTKMKRKALISKAKSKFSCNRGPSPGKTKKKKQRK